jgi:hypothetical protein
MFYRTPAREASAGRHGLRHRARPLRIFAMIAAAAALSACASRGAGDTGAADPTAEARAVQQTMPQQPLHVIFNWDMRDRDARFNGQGVLRLDRGYRARVDLFGPRGETYAAAIVEGEHMRVVPAGADAILPPPALLWSALGVFRPPVDAPLTGTTRPGEDSFSLAYQRDGVSWRFEIQEGLLRSAEWTARGGRRTVQLTGTAEHGLPQQAAFRDWIEFRELTLRVTSVEEQGGFGADVWILPGEF